MYNKSNARAHALYMLSSTIRKMTRHLLVIPVRFQTLTNLRMHFKQIASVPKKMVPQGEQGVT